MVLSQSLWYVERALGALLAVVLGRERAKQDGPNKGAPIAVGEADVAVGMFLERGFVVVRARSAKSATAVRGSWI